MTSYFIVHVMGPILKFTQQGANEPLFFVDIDFSKAEHTSGEFEELGMGSGSGTYDRATGDLDLTIPTKHGDICLSERMADRFALISHATDQKIRTHSPFSGEVSIKTDFFEKEGGYGSPAIITFSYVEMMISGSFH